VENLSHSIVFEMDEDAVAARAIDNAFTVFVLQRGPIHSFLALTEFLVGSTNLTFLPPSALCPQYLSACRDIWHESNDSPLQRDSCRQLVARLRELASMELISPEEVETIFRSLAHTSEHVASVVLLRILECLVDLSDPTIVNELDAFAEGELADDTLSCPMLLELCDSYLWLSHSLASNQHFICDAALALDDGILPDDQYDDEAIQKILLIQQAIETGRQEHMAERLAARREAEAQAAPTGKSTASSVFYPQAIVATNGTGVAIESLLAPIRLQARTPHDALEMMSNMMAPQALVRRIGDLRRAAAAVEAKHQQSARADILHAVYDATDLAPLDAERRGPRQNFLRPLCVEGVGERAGNRLYPHNHPPLQSMLLRLKRELGVEVDASVPQKSHQAVPVPQHAVNNVHRRVTALRQRDYEDRYLSRRRSRAVDRVKKAVEDAAGFFSPTQPRRMLANFDTKMPYFFDTHPKTLNQRNSLKKEVKASTAPSAKDIRHELRIVLTDAVDALARSSQGH
jgi:hypothetical protein